MSRALFADQETPVTLPLFDDGVYWISVKPELNAGEDKQLKLAAFTRLQQTGSKDDPSVAWDMNLEVAAFMKITLYLLDWNLTDKSGKTVAINTPKAKRDALRNLKSSVLSEIERVVDAHALEQEKNDPSGEPTSSTT